MEPEKTEQWMKLEEAKEHLQAIQDLTVKLAEIYTSVYQTARRSPPDDYTSEYMIVANAGIRFSGMVAQGCRRQSTTTVHTLRSFSARALEALEKEARKKLAEERKKRQEAKRPPIVGSEDDLNALFGGEA